jgi:hypothetical protein
MRAWGDVTMLSPELKKGQHTFILRSVFHLKKITTKEAIYFLTNAAISAIFCSIYRKINPNSNLNSTLFLNPVPVGEKAHENV